MAEYLYLYLYENDLGGIVIKNNVTSIEETVTPNWWSAHKNDFQQVTGEIVTPRYVGIDPVMDQPIITPVTTAPTTPSGTTEISGMAIENLIPVMADLGIEEIKLYAKLYSTGTMPTTAELRVTAINYLNVDYPVEMKRMNDEGRIGELSYAIERRIEDPVRNLASYFTIAVYKPSPSTPLPTDNITALINRMIDEGIGIAKEYGSKETDQIIGVLMDRFNSEIVEIIQADKLSELSIKLYNSIKDLDIVPIKPIPKYETLNLYYDYPSKLDDFINFNSSEILGYVRNKVNFASDISMLVDKNNRMITFSLRNVTIGSTQALEDVKRFSNEYINANFKEGGIIGGIKAVIGGVESAMDWTKDIAKWVGIGLIAYAVISIFKK